ncbi:RNA-directed DNA methylation 4 isoform X4 [Medicago truncatula]|uniref:RNA-directed DNA methylation 4 isoform X4 n=1 Tax=Medicago truncatula TaxID=3880 RepID=UPI000D2F1C48|nr:RNA-directed DNA methylation 4 isoform X4 [Medicago truncatula]
MTESSSSPFPPSFHAFSLDRRLKRTLSDFANLSISDSSQNWLEINERPFKRSLLDFGNLSISDSSSSQNVGADSETNVAESSPAAPPSKHVFVRVKRKPFQPPLDAFWLEINERPLKRPLLDFGNLSIANSSQDIEFHNKKVLVQHLKTISSSEVTIDIVRSFLEPRSRSASKSESKVEKRKNFKKVNSSAKDARFEQILKNRTAIKKTAAEKALHEICHFYDIVRIDCEEKIREVQQEDICLEDQRLLANFMPLLIDVIPKAAAEIEADTSVHSTQDTEDYVYDLYTVMDEMIFEEDSSCCYPLLRVQVDDEHFYDGPDNLDYETDDSSGISLCQVDDEPFFYGFDVPDCENDLSNDNSVNDCAAMFSEEEDSPKFSEEEGSPKFSEEEGSPRFSEEEGSPKFSEEEGSPKSEEEVLPKFSKEGSESKSEERKNDSSCNELSDVKM